MNNETIPTHADSYDTLSFVNTACVCVYKRVGYTPLQVVEDIRPFLREEEKKRCTYVGRLDPMAEGWMHVLWSGDMEEKDGLTKLDKLYEVDVVFGIQTDTGDALGLVTASDTTEVAIDVITSKLQDFVGPFTYKYPTYSSPHMKKTLKGEQQDAVHHQKGHIYSIEYVSETVLQSEDLQKNIKEKLSYIHMPGDFRLEKIQEKWQSFFSTEKRSFLQIQIRVRCASGTYMRTLAEELGKKMSSCGFALHIKRIGLYKK